MILPGSTLGLLGGGQLGRMLAIPARQMGYRVAVLAPEGDAPAFGVADHVIHAAYEDPDAARDLAALADVVTYEFENVPAAAVRRIEGGVPVRPGAELLAATQDRAAERALCGRAGVPVARSVLVSTRAEAEAAVERVGLPARLKATRGGYDGGSQWRIAARADLDAVPWREAPWGASGGGPSWILEEEISFEREISVILCRGPTGDTAIFPLFENEHRDGILALTRVPARIPPRVAAEAEAIARALADTVGLVGTLAVELFVTSAGLVVNELAPRVHNSGHLSVEACAVSQFEQHLRAVCGLPLRPPTLRRPAAMANLLGAAELRFVLLAGADAALADPDAALHLYGKRHCRPRRKMGHVTVLADTADEAAARARRYVEAMRFQRGPS